MATREQLPVIEAKSDEPIVIPVIRETALVSKLNTITGRVNVEISTTTERRTETVDLTTVTVREERVPKDIIVEERPATRKEGNTTIIPVLREEVVLVKRLRLVEEIHLIEEATVTPTEQVLEERVDRVSITRS